jgi:hypothetical protein
MLKLHVCYRWTSTMSADPDTIALYVKRTGGHFEPDADTVLYWVPAGAATMLMLAWPELQRMRDRDLI